MVTIWNKGCNPNFAIPTGEPKITLQSPDPSSHQHVENGVPGVHHKRRPQDMTEIS